MFPVVVLDMTKQARSLILSKRRGIDVLKSVCCVGVTSEKENIVQNYG